MSLIVPSAHIKGLHALDKIIYNDIERSAGER
jgi:hypothetical protein